MGLKEKVLELGKLGRTAAFEMASKRFPGMTEEALREGWIPVPAQVLEAGVRDYATKHLPQLQGLTPRCTPAKVDVTADAELAWLAAARLSMAFAIDELALSRAAQRAMLRCSDEVVVEGRNFLGKLAVAFFSTLVDRALQSRIETSAAETEHTVVDWPVITVDLSQLPQVQALTQPRFAGFGLLDLVEIGPAVVEDGYVKLKVGWAR